MPRTPRLGGPLPRQARREHAGVPEEAPAAAARGQVPAAPGGEEGPGSTAGQPITSPHSRNIWPILIHARAKVLDGMYYEQV